MLSLMFVSKSVCVCASLCAAAAVCVHIAFNGYDIYIYLRVFILSPMFHVFNGSFYRFACSFSLLLCGRLLLYIAVQLHACMHA